MKLVEVLGGWVNADHVICAVENDYDTKGFVSITMTNNHSTPIRKEKLADFPLFRLNSKVWINPEHVSSVGLNKIGGEVFVEVVMDYARYPISFSAAGSTEEDVAEWVQTLNTWKEIANG